MVATVVFFLLVGWLACALVMSLAASSAARRAQRREDQIRLQVLTARSHQTRPVDSLVRSHS